MKAKKTAAVVNFTIHSLRLPEDIQDPFQIEFKRGNTVGITEKKFIDRDNEVPFEKTFKCNITLIRPDDASEGEYRKKKIAFTVYRYKKNSRKVYGKFTINAADYLKLKTDTIEVENPHSKKAYVIMTINVMQSDVITAINDLDSQSEAIQLQTDRIDEWDVSDMVTPESRERIQNFFMKREAEKNEQRSRLSDFTRVAVQKEARNSRSRYSNRRGSIDLMKIQTSLPTAIADAAQQAETDIKTPGDNKFKKHNMSRSPSFNSNFMENDMNTKLSTNPTENKEPVKLDNFLAKKNTKRGIPLPTTKEKTETHHSHHRHRSHHNHETNLTLNSTQSTSSIDKINDDEEYDNDTNGSIADAPIVKREISIEDNSTIFQNILSKQWDKSPLNLSKYPISSSVVMAAFSHAHILENMPQNTDDINSFIQMYISSALLSNLHDSIEKWYISSFIAATSFKLKDQLNFDYKKVVHLNSKLSDILLKELYLVLDSSFRPFQQVCRNLIDGTLDDLEISKSLNNSIQAFQAYFTSKKLPQSVIEFFSKEMIKYFDKFLVLSIIKTPEKCTFQNAIKWNTVMTIIYDTEIFSKNMKLFREAASVLMMSTAICQNPQVKNDICPSLDAKIILKILSIQKPDEFLPSPNDLTKFMAFYKLTSENCEPIMNLQDPQISFDIIYSNAYNVNEWKNAKFSQEIFDEFPYFKDFFSTY